MIPTQTLGRAAASLLLLLLLVPTGCQKKPPAPDPEEGPVPAFWRNQAMDLLKKGENRGNFKWDEIYENFRLSSDDYLAADLHDELTASTHFNAGFAAEQLGNREQAEEYYKRALAEKPGLKNALQNLAFIYVGSGRSSEALPFYEAFLKTAPKDGEMRAAYATTFAEAGRFDDGIGVVREMLFDDPEDRLAYKALARIYFLQKEYKLSLVANGNALKFKEDDADIHNNIGITYLHMGDEASAMDSFKKSLEIDENNVESGMNLGWIALRAGDYQLAGRSFDKILNLQPENLDARLGFAIALRGAQEFSSSVEEYDKILVRDKCHARALFNKTMVLIKFIKDEESFGDIKGSEAVLAEYQTCHGEDERYAELKAVIEDEKTRRSEYEEMLREMDRMQKEMERQLAEAKERGKKAFDKALNLRNKYYWCAELVAGDPSWMMFFDDNLMVLEEALQEDYADFINAAIDAVTEFLTAEYGYFTYALELVPDPWSGTDDSQVPVLGCESPGQDPDGNPIDPRDAPVAPEGGTPEGGTPDGGTPEGGSAEGASPEGAANPCANPCASPDEAANPCASPEENANPCASPEGATNPCASSEGAANPCASTDESANPCASPEGAANPCAAPDEAANPCANPCASPDETANPCAGPEGTANPCAANPCAGEGGE